MAGRWHRKDRLRYAVTPRFSLSTSVAMLESCAALLGDVDGALFTSHVNENTAEIDTVRGLFPHCDSYVDSYGDPVDLILAMCGVTFAILAGVALLLAHPRKVVQP